MKIVHFLMFWLFFFLTIKAQDTLNCRLLSKSGNIVNAYGMAVKDDYIYAFSDSLYILDAKDLYDIKPVYSGTFFSVSRNSWMNSIFLHNDLAFISHQDGLIILDISNIQDPEPITLYETDEWIEDVIIHQNNAYLAAWPPAIIILDISDPAKPFEISRIEGNFDDVWDLEISENILFAATENTFGKTFDISDPLNPFALSTMDTLHRTNTVDVKVKGNTVYWLQTAYLTSYDNSIVSAPAFLDSLYIDGEGLSSMYIEGDYIYCLGVNLTIIDISDPKDLKIVGRYPFSPFGIGAELYVRDKVIYTPRQNSGIFFIEFDNETGMNYNTAYLTEFQVFQNYPNPFNPSTTITYSLNESSRVDFHVYNSLGELVYNSSFGERSAGTYSLEFNAANLPSGRYIYQIKTGNWTESKKMLLLK